MLETDDSVRTIATKKKDEAIRGVVILAVGLLTLIQSVVSARDHFEAKNSRVVATVVAPTATFALYDEKPAHAYDRTPIAPSGAIGYIDEAKGSSSRIVIRGWIVTQNRNLARHVFAIVDDRYRYEITRGYGVARPDVAVYLNQSNLRDSGVATTLSTVGLSKGAHRLTLAVFLEPNNALYPIGSMHVFYVSAPTASSSTRAR